MATYSTDLTTMTTAESGTWTEFNNPYNGGGSPGSETENYIQGTGSYSQTTGKANGLEISIVFDNGSNYTFSTDDVLFAWVYYAVGVNIETYANNGWRYGIGSGTGTWDWFRIGGSDYGKNPYGGWVNIAIDPTATQTGTIGGGNGGNYRYFGSVPYTIGEITKGNPSAHDAIRVGRGEISVTGSGGSFSELASYNDYNAGSTPPGTSSTSVDSGRHRLGLFQEQSGTYLWKGLLSLGLTATSVTFSDSNETIIIDDCPHTYAEFNKVEINNASSSVTLTNVTFISTATTSVALGRFEVVDNATVTLNGCSFNDMDTFAFLSNSTVSECIFNSCGQITNGGADFDGSSVLASTVAADTGAVLYNQAADPDGELDNMTISKGANAHHAIDFGTNVSSSLGSITLRGINFSGFGSTDDANDSTVRFLATTGTLTLNLIDCTVDGSSPVASGGSKNFSVDDAAGMTVTVVVQPVDLTITVKDKTTLAVISGVQTSIHTNDTSFTQLMNEDTNASGIATEQYSGTTPVEVVWRCRKSDDLDDPRYFAASGIETVTTDGLNITVLLERNRFLN